jgi:hypothetical protein
MSEAILRAWDRGQSAELNALLIEIKIQPELRINEFIINDI